jgi:lipopolysaccharide transport system permease protein
MNTPASDMQSAWVDWRDGTRNARAWWTMAWYDIVLRYRRSMLGPLWLTISMGAMLLGMGPLYAAIFKVPLRDFFPHLALGIIFWHLFTGTINDACNTFIGASNHLKRGGYPISLFAWRVWARNLIQFVHHIVLIVPVAVWAGMRFAPVNLVFFAGFAIAILNLLALTFSLGIICARFRDVPQIISSVMQLLMFVTPVFWLPESLPARARIILFNPFALLLDIMRAPLLGRMPDAESWWAVVGWTVANVLLAVLLFVRKRSQIVYWL